MIQVLSLDQHVISLFPSCFITLGINLHPVGCVPAGMEMIVPAFISPRPDYGPESSCQNLPEALVLHQFWFLYIGSGSGSESSGNRDVHRNLEGQLL